MSVKTANRDINALLPAAQKACRLFLQECHAAGLNVFITKTYRSAERQKWLYAQGRTRDLDKPKVTWTLNSNHMSRLAWDVAVNPPKNLYDTATLNKAGAIARRLGIQWGGDWTKTPDKPHFQVPVNWKAPAGSASTAGTGGAWHVEYGDSGSRVLVLQKALNTLGYKVAEDSQFGPSLKAAYIAFQKANSLTPDGLYGPAGQKKMAEVLASQKTLSKEEMDELDQRLPLTQQKDMANLLRCARQTGVFEVDHSDKAPTMTRRQAYDLTLSYVARKAVEDAKKK
ncbi:hypothetical protein NCCP2716_01110 [Sporosarcina sp. NCCP-2716]|uniref:peptidoglycan-binding protein n=1 Tax=Sporosarcina sp. NCCP-2716 TaxID=2943679 RepID=UPI00203C5786|nr:peptidoglycan-binding protein [Sporosarcina sp. NCCP-2716]GKV67613.1 hypothetical protein NCCP2716_01110 [Sporosarcina sp. NCCP-2716]